MTKKQTPAKTQADRPASTIDPSACVVNEVHTLAQIIFRHLATTRGFGPWHTGAEAGPVGPVGPVGPAGVGPVGPGKDTPPHAWSGPTRWPGSQPGFYWYP